MTISFLDLVLAISAALVLLKIASATLKSSINWLVEWYGTYLLRTYPDLRESEIEKLTSEWTEKGMSPTLARQRAERLMDDLLKR